MLGNLGSETWQQIYERPQFPGRPYKPPLPSRPKGALNVVGTVWDLVGLGPVMYRALRTATKMSWESSRIGKSLGKLLATAERLGCAVPNPTNFQPEYLVDGGNFIKSARFNGPLIRLPEYRCFISGDYWGCERLQSECEPICFYWKSWGV